MAGEPLGSSLCPVCGSRTAAPDAFLTAVVRAEPPEQIVRCAGCGLVRREPRRSLERASETYGEAYYKQYEAEIGMSGDAGGELRPHLKKRLAMAQRLVGTGRLLEIGCGKGFFIDYARGQGWRVSGVEVSEAAGRMARAKGLEVYIGPVETLPPSAEPIDFVHMNHVLEHLSDPVAVLRQVRAMLSPNGIVIIEVPNEFDNLFFRLGRHLLPQREVVQAIPSTHEFFFTPETFRRAVTAAGLTPSSCRTVRWKTGGRSGVLGRTAKRAVYLLERLVDRSGNIEAVLRR